jgi:hypothetical protein
MGVDKNNVFIIEHVKITSILYITSRLIANMCSCRSLNKIYIHSYAFPVTSMQSKAFYPTIAPIVIEN